MPFDFADLSVQDMLHIDAQCAAVDLKILPTNVKPFSLPLPVESNEVTIELGTGGPESKMELSTQNDRVIAVDFDDVLAQSCVALTEAHNKHYGTNLTLDDFESYYPHRNRGWGSVEETNQKLAWFHKDLNVLQWAAPVDSVRAALLRVKKMGHPLHIVTARSEAEKPFVLDWLERHDLDNLWDGIHFIGAFQFVADATEQGKKSARSPKDSDGGNNNVIDMERRLKEAFLKNADKNGKVAVLESINAKLLIDDHVLNVDKAAEAGIQCLLFGEDYRWNRRRWGMQTPEDAMHYEERKQAGLAIPAAELELLAGVERVANWKAVVGWIEKWDKESALLADKEGRAKE